MEIQNSELNFSLPIYIFTSNINFLKLSLQSLFSFPLEISLTSNDVTDEVWHTISNNPSFTLDHWRILSSRLGYGDGNMFTNLFNWRRNVDSLKKFLLKRNVSWRNLKLELHNMNRQDIIDNLCQNTNLTKGKLFFKYHVIFLRITIYIANLYQFLCN